MVPPALSARDEPFEGYEVLDEVRDDLGLLLWQSLRDADLWSTSAPEARSRLFSPHAPGRRGRQLDEVVEDGSEIDGPLRTLALLLEGAPELEPEHVVDACRTLSRWAGDHGLPRTALAFAQSAALAAPDRPAPAYVVGLLARRNADNRRAEAWFRRALGLARRAEDWKYYGLACMGIGNLNVQRGDYPVARTWFFKALRVARRHGLWTVRPVALHDLFCVAANAGHVEEAEIFARRAFRAYGRRHPRLVRLAHDVARMWLMRGQFHRSLQVFRAVLRHIHRPAEQRLVMSNMARAAAGAGDRLAFATLWADVWALVDNQEDSERVAETLINLAQGAAALGDPDRGQMAAAQALKVATLRGESEPRLLAEALLEQLRRPRPPAPPLAPHEEPSGRHSEALANDLVEALAYDSTEGSGG